jgi:hypothetical protein
MAYPVPARLLILAFLVTFLGFSVSTVAQTPAQGQQPADPQQPAGPVDPAESGGAEVAPLRIGPVTLSGSAWIESQFNGDDVADDTFRLRRARIGLAGNLTPKVGWNITGEFTSQPALRNAFLLFRFAEQLNVRLGQATPPTGLERGTSPLVIELIDRSRLTNDLTHRLDNGITVSNAQPFRGWIAYALSVVNGVGFNRGDNNDGKDVAGRLEITPPDAPGLTFNVSGGTGEQPSGRRTRNGLGVEYDVDQFKVLLEGLRQSVEGLPVSDGIVMMGVYRLRPRTVTPHFRMLELAARFVVFNDPAAALGVGSSGPDEDSGGDSGPSGPVPATTRDLQFGGNYYVNRNVRLMVNALVPLDERASRALTSRLQVVF